MAGFVGFLNIENDEVLCAAGVIIFKHNFMRRCIWRKNKSVEEDFGGFTGRD